MEEHVIPGKTYITDPGELDTGPDTTENINEIVDEEHMNDEIDNKPKIYDPIFKHVQESYSWWWNDEPPVCNKNVSQQGYTFDDILRNMKDTHDRKNSDYGDAAYKGYKKYGDYYFLVQLTNKLSRLESLTVENKTQQVKDESIDDTLLDMANYAVLYLESRHRDETPGEHA